MNKLTLILLISSSFNRPCTRHSCSKNGSWNSRKICVSKTPFLRSTAFSWWSMTAIFTRRRQGFFPRPLRCYPCIQGPKTPLTKQRCVLTYWYQQPKLRDVAFEGTSFRVRFIIDSLIALCPHNEHGEFLFSHSIPRRSLSIMDPCMM